MPQEHWKYKTKFEQLNIMDKLKWRHEAELDLARDPDPGHVAIISVEDVIIPGLQCLTEDVIWATGKTLSLPSVLECLV